MLSGHYFIDCGEANKQDGEEIIGKGISVRKAFPR